MDTLVELLERAVARHGERPALVIKPAFRRRVWTYVGLYEHAQQMRGYLQSRGVERGDRVLLWAPNQPAWVGALFGALLAGAVAVPLDVRSTAEFACRVADQAGVKLAFVGGAAQAAQLAEAGVRAELLADLGYRLSPLSRGAPVSVEGDDLAELVYTSGTTGDPKGVMLTHRNIASNVDAALQVVHIAPETRFVSFLPLSHMLEQTAGLFAPLAVGASVTYPTSRQPASLLRTMSEARVNAVVAVPAVLQLFLGGIERELRRRGREASFRRALRLAERLPPRGRRWLFRAVHKRFGGALDFFFCGGAYLDPELAHTWERMGVRVVQGYGTTECSPVVAANTIDRRVLDSVGRAIPGVEVRTAADGEVQVRGPNVFRGYWHNPEATRATFTEDGWYRTGDLGEIDGHGDLRLRGRQKDLIVLSDGQNVYPEDVEREVAVEPGVGDAVVLGVGGADGRVELHAVLLADDRTTAEAALRRANGRLAPHQQVAGFTLWPGQDFPRTTTLKVKRGLVATWLEEERRGQAPTAPAGGVPGAAGPSVVAIVARLVERDAKAIHGSTNLGPDLGLDSLGRVELLSAIEEELGVFVDDAEVGPTTTVGELEALVERAGEQVRRPRFPSWPMWRIVSLLRVSVLLTLAFALIRLLYSVRVRGRENLRGLHEPVVFIANHCSHLDNAMLMLALPYRWRRRLAIAAAADDIFGPRIKGWLAALIGNAFPFSREGAVRPSLEHLGRLLDRGYSVLLYPEGKLTVGGPVQPFKQGVGLIAVESAAPVVPLKIAIERHGLGEEALARGRAVVRIGQPLRLSGAVSYQDVTEQLERLLREM